MSRTSTTRSPSFPSLDAAASAVVSSPPVLAFERAEESSLGGLDRAAVQSKNSYPDSPCLDAERLDKRRLADAGDSMDKHDEWAALADQSAKDVHLAVAPNQPCRLLVDQLANGLGHRVILRCASIKPRSRPKPG